MSGGLVVGLFGFHCFMDGEVCSTTGVSGGSVTGGGRPTSFFWGWWGEQSGEWGMVVGEAFLVVWGERGVMARVAFCAIGTVRWGVVFRGVVSCPLWGDRVWVVRCIC